tara:strand:+ start:280 stop:489 length:210 start_codon:yes stop_codon:yes gene_type:complete
MLKSIQQQIFDLQDSLSNLSAQIEEKQGQINALTKTNVDLHKQIQALSRDMDSTKNDIVNLERETGVSP